MYVSAYRKKFTDAAVPSAVDSRKMLRDEARILVACSIYLEIYTVPVITVIISLWILRKYVNLELDIVYIMINRVTNIRLWFTTIETATLDYYACILLLTINPHETCTITN